MSELYDAVLARVGDHVDELRKQSQERRSKRPRNEAVAVSGFAASSSDAGQFVVDSDAAQLAARSVLKRERPFQKQLRAGESDAAQLAAASGDDEIAVALGGGGSSSSGARPAKREKLITVNSETVSSSDVAQLAGSDAAQLAELETGRAWLTEQLTQKQVAWYKELLDMVPLLQQRPSGRDGQAKLRAMASKLACNSRNLQRSQEAMHEACIRQWLARIRGLMTYARSGLQTNPSDASSGAGQPARSRSSGAAQALECHRRYSLWWLDCMKRLEKEIHEREKQAPETHEPEEWRRWKARLQWARGKNTETRSSMGSFTSANIYKAVREWSKNDKAWWAHHELRLRGQHSKQLHQHAYVHYNACAV